MTGPDPGGGRGQRVPARRRLRLRGGPAAGRPSGAGRRADPDFGIRGVHLAYDLLNGCDLFVLVDAAPRGEAPGTVTVLEVEVPDPASLTGPVMDAHSLTPDAIFALLASLGGRPGRSLVVACEPADVSAGMGLSEPVSQAVPHAARTVEEILASAAGSKPATMDGQPGTWERGSPIRSSNPRQ